MLNTWDLSKNAAARDALAKDYDRILPDSRLGRAQQDLIYRELDRCFHPGQLIMEIDCATGIDTIHLAGRGIAVLACEGSPRMLELARSRVDSARLRAPVSLNCLTAQQISKLQDKSPLDGAFCNWGGLNCVEDLAAVGRDLATLLKRGARAVLCMAGRFVGWEVIVSLKNRQVRHAFHRLFRGPYYGRLVDDFVVPCWYPSVRGVARALGPAFALLRWRGVGVSLPPVFLERHARRHANIVQFLERIDPWLGAVPLVRGLADHLLLTFERT